MWDVLPAAVLKVGEVIQGVFLFQHIKADQTFEANYPDILYYKHCT